MRSLLRVVKLEESFLYNELTNTEMKHVLRFDSLNVCIHTYSMHARMKHLYEISLFVCSSTKLLWHTSWIDGCNGAPTRSTAFVWQVSTYMRSFLFAQQPSKLLLLLVWCLLCQADFNCVFTAQSLFWNDWQFNWKREMNNDGRVHTQAEEEVERSWTAAAFLQRYVCVTRPTVKTEGGGASRSALDVWSKSGSGNNSSSNSSRNNGQWVTALGVRVYDVAADARL